MLLWDGNVSKSYYKNNPGSLGLHRGIKSNPKRTEGIYVNDKVSQAKQVLSGKYGFEGDEIDIQLVTLKHEMLEREVFLNGTSFPSSIERDAWIRKEADEWADSTGKINRIFPPSWGLSEYEDDIRDGL